MNNQVIFHTVENKVVFNNTIEQVSFEQTSFAVNFLAAQGPAGISTASYTHTQFSASVQWTINHNLGFNPNIELRTTGGQVMIAEIVHVSTNQAIAYFNTAVAGSATCS